MVPIFGALPPFPLNSIVGPVFTGCGNIGTYLALLSSESGPSASCVKFPGGGGGGGGGCGQSLGVWLLSLLLAILEKLAVYTASYSDNFNMMT